MNHASIRVADPIHVVWAQFLQWIEVNTEPDKVVVMVAWNGVSCDLKRLWKLTQAPMS